MMNRETEFWISKDSQSTLTLESNSWLSGGCFCKLCGNITVSSSGFSARRAPLITAALVPDAPDVNIWFFCKEIINR